MKFLLNENISKEKYDMIKYPLYRYHVTFKEIKESLLKLSNYKPIILDEDSIRNQFKRETIVPIDGKKIIYVTDYYIDIDMVHITDYFSEKCRIKCSHMNNLSPLDYFTTNKDFIYNHLTRMYGKVTMKLIDTYLYKNIKICTNFYTTIVVNLLNYFKPTNYLDFCAGWGDRLVGAIAYGKCNYTGIDPSQCMIKRYNKIIKKLANKSNRLEQYKYTIINKPFEDVVLTEKYDLVFTSPPFFDLEIYEDPEKKKELQSVSRYNTIDTWFENFMQVAINRSIDALIIGGHLALYIGDSMNDSYVKRTKDYIDSLDSVKYIGNLNWFNKSSSNRLRIIRVWIKV